MNTKRIEKIKELKAKGWVRFTHFTLDLWVDPKIFNLENLDDNQLENLEEEIEAKFQAFGASVVVRPGVDYTL